MAVAKLGIGLNYQPQFRHFLEQHSSEFDFLEIVPDIFWLDRGAGLSPRYLDDPAGIAFLQSMRRSVPVVLHSIGLSIGSAHRFNREHVGQIAAWRKWLDFEWHSDHLSFHLARPGLAEAHGFPGSFTETNAGVTMPLPRNRATLRRLARRVEMIRRSVAAPFLLENNVYFVNLPGDEMEEADFLNALCRETGCGLLLDLHNVYVNSRNMGADAGRLLAALDLSNVVEIHLGGGTDDGPYYLDSHSGPTPEPVWRLLESVLHRAPNLRGIVFELFGSWFETLGDEGLSAELLRMKAAWSRHLTAFSAARGAA